MNHIVEEHMSTAVGSTPELSQGLLIAIACRIKYVLDKAMPTSRLVCPSP